MHNVTLLQFFAFCMQVRCYDPQTIRQTFDLRCHTSKVTCVDSSYLSGYLIATGCHDRRSDNKLTFTHLGLLMFCSTNQLMSAVGWGCLTAGNHHQQLERLWVTLAAYCAYKPMIGRLFQVILRGTSVSGTRGRESNYGNLRAGEVDVILWAKSPIQYLIPVCRLFTTFVWTGFRYWYRWCNDLSLLTFSRFRHPVKHLRFTSSWLVSANIPSCRYHSDLDSDKMTHIRWISVVRLLLYLLSSHGLPIHPYFTATNIAFLCFRYRGRLQACDFSVDQQTVGVPTICSSTYDAPEASTYNIALLTPYDKIWLVLFSQVSSSMLRYNQFTLSFIFCKIYLL